MRKLKVIVFEGVQNLPIFAAQEEGYFAGEDIDLDLTFTPNSWTLRNGLAVGEYDIAHTAVDNAIAMVELDGHDVNVVMGGDNGFNCLFWQPDIRSFEDLRGRTVLVDAPNTAFALILYRIMEKNGLDRGDYVVESVGATPLRLERLKADRTASAAILNLPYLVQGKRAGLQLVCKATDEIGPYLSTAAFAMREWSRANPDVLTAYIRAYVKGLRWSLDPAHSEKAVAILARRLNLSAEVANECYAIAVAGQDGLTPDAHIDLAGLHNVLALRAHVEGQWDGEAPDAGKYIEAQYHTAALAALGPA